MKSDAYYAIRHGAAVIRRSDRGLIAVDGPDRADYLQGLLTNDVAALGNGAGCYAAYLTPQGRMVADMDVFSLDGRMLLDVSAAVAPVLAARLDSLIFTEDATVADWTGTHVSHAVHGPQALDVAGAALERLGAGREAASGVRGLGPHRCLTVSADGMAVVAARGDELGVPGLSLVTERDSAEALRAALVTAGGVEIDAATTEVVRVESGRPAFPADMDTETIPLEAGIEGRAISLAKGCYVGQEVIIRVLHRGGGRVARKLVGLTLDLADGAAGQEVSVPNRGVRLHHDGQPVGEVTSAVVSPALGGVIALGYLPRALAEAGTRVDVELDGGLTAAVVTAVPFVEPADGLAAIGETAHGTETGEAPG